MELTTLKQFREVARVGHMTRAAETAGVSQPALSAMVKKLESELGAELFHRTSRGVELTDAGKVFLVHAEDAIRASESGVQAVRELVGLERGQVRVGGGATATTYLLPGAISDFRSEHPGVRFYIRESGSRAVAEAVRSGELDLGVVTRPLGGRLEQDLNVIPLAEDELRLIAPPGHALHGASAFSWSQLEGEAIVAFEAGSAVRTLIDSEARRAGIEPVVAMELRSIESIKQMVASGVGVGFVSRFALGKADGASCADGPITRDLAIVEPLDHPQSTAAAGFCKKLLARK